MAFTRHANKEFLNFPDCQGLSETGKCTWLGLSECQGETCPFKKTADSSRRTQRRLCELDEETQMKISKKYYNGRRPWSEK